jgi:hypothetical protein
MKSIICYIIMNSQIEIKQMLSQLKNTPLFQTQMYLNIIETKLNELDNLGIKNNNINIKNYIKILKKCQMISKCDFCSRDSLYETIHNNEKYCWIHAQTN